MGRNIEGATFRLLVSGDYACFPIPKMLDATISYEIIPPVAAYGLIESVHWKPAIRWRISAIHVLSPVQLVEVRAPQPILALYRPRWAIDFGFSLTQRAGPRDSIDAHASMFLRKAKRLPRQHGFLGKPHFPASLELMDAEQALDMPLECAGTIDFGWLPLHRLDWDPKSYRYFRARARDGTVQVPEGITDLTSHIRREALSASALLIEEPYDFSLSRITGAPPAGVLDASLSAPHVE
ncbi:CRISPR-associated protein Cas5 [Sphingomonas desiccabilis]|uniref:CRISPR-associated protein Cas5 n=1 Tax=Sphingomonas desiccabilis TaxID=429134 RepID=A0A4Q2IYY2_9SPHN|nr:CRISPR-associated protein Cas5 [Sphingomonas desiccabilis]MBB3909764.1 CRISPR-associated protein Cas5d [Sphingomonas desiccabilis]RXZ34454.1 CRISPR-associated protein Cas5 [Sphingomonas desiccabilis]